MEASKNARQEQTDKMNNESYGEKIHNDDDDDNDDEEEDYATDDEDDAEIYASNAEVICFNN